DHRIRIPCRVASAGFPNQVCFTAGSPVGWDCHNQTVPTTFTLTTRARHRAEDLFDLSLSIDTHLASMAGSDEQAVAGTTSGQIGLGETVTWRARHCGVWFTMTAEVIELE